ncbi:cytochrome-c oxidase [Vibrio sp. MACH09]|uniref:cbb3-type cytochrome oxidase subunit 3 n=1 Tax=unclassified Vibrio TaxID=2614977 RepID=UPI001493BD7F|nr:MULTISPECIES: CcoQ/FixQ family Cbb3-type cytochrome c oxidase assembly chaperone [unclassified Vibrio]NOI65449.1 CcoQ/FixQ family Cbb3-type cytochrome c oxidase assembly chaperone [Vibrio sp. 99-8-1]GLO60961.1 cytochrome-c oxidase [Vibrio sp. MACH09]
MNIATFHSILTVAVFVSFLGVFWWAFSKSRKSRFEEDANLVFADEQDSSTKTDKGVSN